MEQQTKGTPASPDELPRDHRRLIFALIPQCCCGLSLTVVGLVELDGSDVADLAVEANVVEPVDVDERVEVDVADVSPGSVALDQLCLVETDRRLGHGIVRRVTNASDRRRCSDVGQPF